MEKYLILVIDGSEYTRLALKELLTSPDCQVHTAPDGIAALMLFHRNEYQLIITETKLPELDGKSVLRQIKKTSDAPIVVLSSCNDEKVKMEYFSLGIDDYVTKPYSDLELHARIQAILRRSAIRVPEPTHNLVFDGLYIDTQARTIYVDDRLVSLTPKEYELLLYLAHNPNRAFSREMLLNAVWGYDFYGNERTVDTHIKTLREALTPHQNLISTVWGFGYKFIG